MRYRSKSVARLSEKYFSHSKETSPEASPEASDRFSTPLNVQGVDISALDASGINLDALASLTELPSSPLSPPAEYEHRRAKSFFSNLRASKSTSRLDAGRNMSQHGDDDEITSIPSRPDSSHASKFYPFRKAPGSTPELSTFLKKEKNTSLHDKETSPVPDISAVKLPLTSPLEKNVARHRPAKSELLGNSDKSLPAIAADKRETTLHDKDKNKTNKSSKRRLPEYLYRPKSARAEEESMSASPKPSTNTGRLPLPPGVPQNPAHSTTWHPDVTVSRSAPSDKARPLKDAMKSSSRTRSEDRAVPVDSEEDKRGKRKDKKASKEKENHKERDQHLLGASGQRHNTSFFSIPSKAADGIGKASRGLFKLARSGSSTERVGVLHPEEEHEVRLLKLPLIEQTRETRIAKSYDHCKDKTEFWMPALPWRCIDFLNGKCEEEGLYRVSGGVKQVKEWRKRFDIERDVNLLDEPDLYDSSIIASLFKEWIRELPEEVFPKAIQHRIIPTLPSEVPGKEPVPQALRDELSNLPPFNYYLLFAITCHLSLLLSHESKNRMSLDNLYRCFNQSLKLDGRIFFTLVGDWRQCWQGCATETDFLRAEYEYLKTPLPKMQDVQTARKTAPNNTGDATMSDDVAAISSSDAASAHSATGRSTPENQRPSTAQTQPSRTTDDIEMGNTSDSTAAAAGKKKRSSSDVTGISPIKGKAAIL